MSDDPGHDGAFLSRWSRRKRGVDPADTPVMADGQEAPAVPGTPGTQGDPAAVPVFSDQEIDALDFHSDYKRVMAAGVPDALRNRALQKLWTSNPVISTPDELDDYLEDFSEAAMAVPAELLRSAYQVGRGLLTPDEIAARSDGETSQPDGAVPPEDVSKAGGDTEADTGESATPASAQPSDSAAADSDVETATPDHHVRQT